MPTPVIAIFDIGKTNKKFLLFNEHYEVAFEKSYTVKETVDDDGDPCENVESLKLTIIDALYTILKRKDFTVKAVNFAGYGASLVHIDAQGKVVAPLYNYLKTYPESLKQQFYETYGGQKIFTQQTASPVLGSLNSGMQLYRIKHEKPQLFKKIKYALHLPQYLSYIVSGKACSDITSIGCHTNLWDFQRNNYHDWVTREEIFPKLAPIASTDKTIKPDPAKINYELGIGIHDSSAALIPYLFTFKDPFVLLSTGTWCITLNPFNHEPLTGEELQKDCLCYLQYTGRPVKASRLLAGYEHDRQIKRIGAHFNQATEYYHTIAFNPKFVSAPEHKGAGKNGNTASNSVGHFAQRSLSDFASGDEAYHCLVYEMVERQRQSIELVLQGPNVQRLFVDGGFSKNSVYMNLLAASFPSMEVYASVVPQATALGAAMVVHACWNNNPLPQRLIHLNRFNNPLRENEK